MSESSTPASSRGSSSGGTDAPWEQLDTTADVPRRTATPTTPATTRRLRLRRTQSHVLAALDGGGSMLQRHGRDVLVGSSLLLLPVVALNVWATTQIFDRTGATTLAALGGDDVGTGIEDVAAALAVISASFAAAVVGCFAAVMLLGDRFGSPVGLRSALTSTLRRLPAVLIVWATGHVWLPFLATWSFSSRSGQIFGRLVLTLPVAALCSTATLLAVPVMVAERTGPLGALRRSWKLARLRFGTAFGFVASATMLGGMLLTGITLLPSLAEDTGFLTLGEYTGLAQSIATQLGVIIVVPLIALATAQLYIQIRLDAEAMDIVLDADEAFGRRRVDDGATS